MAGEISVLTMWLRVFCFVLIIIIIIYICVYIISQEMQQEREFEITNCFLQCYNEGASLCLELKYL